MAPARGVRQRPRRPTSAVVAALTVVCVLAAGCGSSSTGGTRATKGAVTSSPAPTSAPAAALASLPGFGTMPTGPLDDRTAGRLQAALRAVVAGGEPDVLAAVVTPEGTWTGAAGVDGPGGRAAEPHDMFALASVTKLFTATLAMRLVEQKTWGLDDPLADYLGTHARLANGATVGQAVAMRAGIAGTSDAALAKITVDPTRRWSIDDVLSELDPPIAPPGQRRFTSNPTYKLLALAAEQVTGKPYRQLVRDELLAPAGGALRIVQQGDGRPTPRPWALPVGGDAAGLPAGSLGAGNALPSISDATFSYGTASLAGDAASLAAWGWHLFAGDIVSTRSLAVMATVDDTGEGLGMRRLYELNPDVAYGETGSKPGYSAVLAVLPERQTAIAMLVNREGISWDAHLKDMLVALG